MSRLGRLSVVAVLLLSVAGACTDSPGQDVRTGTARLGTVAEVVEAPASINARAVATVSAPAAGRIGRLAVADGQQVAAGAVLAVIDSPTTQQRLGQAQRAVAAASSGPSGGGGIALAASQRRSDKAAANAFGQAEAAADRIADPKVRDAAIAQLAAAQTQYEAVARDARAAANALSRGIGRLNAAVSSVSAAQRIQAQTAYDLAKSQVDALTLRAPVAGIVQLGGPSTSSSPSDLLANLPAEVSSQLPAQAPESGAQTDTLLGPGSQIGAGSAVATIVDVSGLTVTASVDETDVLLVAKGNVASVELDAVAGAIYRGAVTAVALLPATSSRGGVSYRVRLSLGDGTLGDGKAAPRPRPGMSAVAKIQVRKVESVVAIPASALVRDGARDAVWVAEDGKARRRIVTVGAQGEDTVEIVGGLRAGEKLVTGGADRVKSGQDLP